jgi:SecD/SecF fusion protein
MRTSRWKLFGYAFIILLGCLIALPNVLSPQVTASVPGLSLVKPVTLGLDLRGGAHLLFAVDRHALAEDRLQDLAGQAKAALGRAKVITKSIAIEGDRLVVALEDNTQQAAVISILRGLAVPVMRDGVETGSDIEVNADKAGNVIAVTTPAGIEQHLTSAIGQSLGIVRKRIDETGIAEANVQQVGADRILVEAPGEQDPKRIRDQVGRTAKLSFHLLGKPDAGRLAAGVDVLKSSDGSGEYQVLHDVAISGDRLIDAQLSFDPTTKRAVVAIRFDTVGARQFATVTREHQGEQFAIVLDDTVLSAPQINHPIVGGSAQIIGSFTPQEAADLAALLRAGALPVPLTVVDEGTVGADLGSDSIEMGIYTGLAGLALVLAFMVALYGWWGLLANAALALNVVLTLSALSLFGATLTLPGIAGIVLSIGLAVDANVLINERIREETRKGVSAFAALDAGFRRAYATIVDSNMTGLIATAVLFIFGSGPVQGFAVTMAIGIAISMFTAVSVVRVAMTEIVRWKNLKTLRIDPPLKLIPDGTSIPFMRGRFIGIAMSAILSLASVALFVVPGLNYGIDFKGGVQLEITTPDTADLGMLRDAFDHLGLGEISLQEQGASNNVRIRAEQQPGGEEAQTKAVDTIRAKLQDVAPGAVVDKSAVIGPKVGGELAQAGILAVILACVAMFIYIWARFEWPFAVGAIATLVLDTTKIVGLFALTGLDFSLTAIAALLTLIGYSVNDKVVVYDRMRENMRLFKKMPLRELIDRSINETLARSLYTSVTALFSILPMAIWGGKAVESFAVPMAVGIVIAASSSVFIAAPILLFLGDWRQRRRGARKAIGHGTSSQGAEVADRVKING